MLLVKGNITQDTTSFLWTRIVLRPLWSGSAWTWVIKMLDALYRDVVPCGRDCTVNVYWTVLISTYWKGWCETGTCNFCFWNCLLIQDIQLGALMMLMNLLMNTTSQWWSLYTVPFIPHGWYYELYCLPFVLCSFVNKMKSGFCWPINLFHSSAVELWPSRKSYKSLRKFQSLTEN